jgi:hypothetical protein
MPTVKFPAQGQSGKAAFRGINNAYDSAFNPVTDAEDCRNVVLGEGPVEKRAGFQEIASFFDEGTPLGMFDYVKNDGTTVTLEKVGRKLFAVSINALSASAVELSADGSLVGEPVDFSGVNNRVYFCDGSTFKVTDGISVFNAELPTVPNLLSASVAGGNLTGLYEHRVTYYSSTWGQESNASSSPNAINALNTSVDITIQRTSDTRVDKVRVYRRKVSAGENLWYFSLEANHTPGSGTFVVNDNVKDSDVSSTSTAPLPIGIAPIPKFMTYQADVMFAAGDPAFPNRLYFTPPGKPFAIVGFVDIGSTGDSDPITALFAYRGLLFVGKRKSIWAVDGNSEDTIYVRKVWEGSGPVGHHSVEAVGDLVYYLGEDEVYVFDGSQATPISRPVHERIVNRNFARDRFSVSCHLYDLGAILWSFSDSGQQSNQKILVYFYRYSEEVGFPVWSPWTFAFPLAYPALVTDGTTKKRVVALGFADGNGKTGVYGGTTDDGDVIDFLWRSGKIDLDEPSRWKILGELMVDFVPQLQDSLIDIKMLLDSDFPTDIQLGYDMVDPVFRNRVSSSARQFRYEFANNNTSPVVIRGWEQDVALGGSA